MQYYYKKNRFRGKNNNIDIPKCLFFRRSPTNATDQPTYYGFRLSLTQRYLLVRCATIGVRCGSDCGERDTVQDGNCSWPGHFAGSDDTHQLEAVDAAVVIGTARVCGLQRRGSDARRQDSRRATRPVNGHPSADYQRARGPPEYAPSISGNVYRMVCTRVVLHTTTYTNNGRVAKEWSRI